MSDLSDRPLIRGRGAAGNPGNRFERTSYTVSEWDEPEDPSRDTVFLKDTTRSIITYNDSPDVGFDASINPYRGCEHGCIYCLSLIHISEPTRLMSISYAVFCLKKKKKKI